MLGCTVAAEAYEAVRARQLANEDRLVVTYLARNGEGSPVVPKGELIMDEARFAFYRGLAHDNQITDLKAHSVSESTVLR